MYFTTSINRYFILYGLAFEEPKKNLSGGKINYEF